MLKWTFCILNLYLKFIFTWFVLLLNYLLFGTWQIHINRMLRWSCKVCIAQNTIFYLTLVDLLQVCGSLHTLPFDFYIDYGKMLQYVHKFWRDTAMQLLLPGSSIKVSMLEITTFPHYVTKGILSKTISASLSHFHIIL